MLDLGLGYSLDEGSRGRVLDAAPKGNAMGMNR